MSRATLLALERNRQAAHRCPVAVGNNGPYNFIIDTGAERTVVSRETRRIAQLGPSAPVVVTSMSGRDRVSRHRRGTKRLSIESIGEQPTIIAPALEARNIGKHSACSASIRCATIRYHDRLREGHHWRCAQREAFKAFTKRDPQRGIVVTAKNVFGQLIVTDAYYDNTRIQVVLDTSSQVTMGNSALRKRVGRSAPKAQPITLTSVIGNHTTADYTEVPSITVGKVRFGAMPVAFADVAPFERFGLTRRPALLLDMDALRELQPRRHRLSQPARSAS